MAEIDTLRADGEPKSADVILTAIQRAERYWTPYQAICDDIDEAYARLDDTSIPWSDTEYDVFWASTEVLKPAIYARIPKPVVAPMFNDRRPLYVTTADVLERAVVSAYERAGLDEALICARDDLIFYNRAAIWVSYESDDGQRVCIDHLDRRDFLHPPARKWSEVPWVARRAWMSRDAMAARFGEDAAEEAAYLTPDGDRAEELEGRASVWEVWHKADKRVYWVAKGCRDILDQGAPHYDLEGFFPCPRPAFGTLRHGTLEPRPDFLRYAGLFSQINRLTRRIYDLLAMVRMKGLIPAGGDVGDAIEQLVKEDSASSILVPVPGAALATGAGNFVQWMPIADVAAAITGLIEARRELMSDFDRLSGISDIMRGETEASETLGAQRMKGQYGSIRVKTKCDEIVRLSRDVTRIAAELMAEYFRPDLLMKMAQMELPTRKELKAQVEAIEDAAEKEMNDLMEKAAETKPDPEQAQEIQAQFLQAQNEIMERYAPQLKRMEIAVASEDVIDLLRDGKARNFAFEIETDSTILTDEVEAKDSAAQFYQAFTAGMSGMVSAASLGPEAVRMAGEVLKSTLAPYRPARSVMSAIDEFIDVAPDVAARMAAEDDNEGTGALADAQMELARAEQQKAEAQIAKVQADAALKMQELELRAQEAQAKANADQQKFGLELQEQQGKISKTQADIQRIFAEIELAKQRLGIEAHREQREDAKLAADIQERQMATTAVIVTPK